MHCNGSKQTPFLITNDALLHVRHEKACGPLHDAHDASHDSHFLEIVFPYLPFPHVFEHSLAMPVLNAVTRHSEHSVPEVHVAQNGGHG